MNTFRHPRPSQYFAVVLILLAGLFPAPMKALDSLESTAMKILSQSPRFVAQTYSIESALAESKTASNLPDPELGGEYLVAPPNEDNRWSAELSWGVEWPGVYGARAKEARLKVDALEKEVWTQRNILLGEIRDLLLDFVQCRVKIGILDNLTQNNDTIYRLAEEAAKGGELTVLDLNKVRLEYANIRGARAAILDEEASIIASLSAIYGHDASPLLNEMECRWPDLILPSQEELEIIKQSSPEVQKALAEAEAARQAKSLAKMTALPSLSVGYKHAFEDGMHFNGATLGISIPILSSHGKQKAASSAIKEAQFQAEGLKQEISADIDAIIRRLSRIKMQIDEIAPIVENADYNSALLKAYKGGVITLLEYISDRNYFTSAALELVNLRLSAAKTLSSLQKYMGASRL